MINLPLIASLAEPHWGDNWNFRAYLQLEVDPVEIDDAAAEIYADVAAKIDCTKCGNCCREVYPFLSSADESRLVEGLMNSGRAIPALQSEGGDERRTFCAKPCPMLEGDRCSVYEFRPDDCRNYPHLDRPDFLGGSVGFIENYGTCPIVFHVYSRMKAKFSYDPSRDYVGDNDPELTHGSLYQNK